MFVQRTTNGVNASSSTLAMTVANAPSAGNRLILVSHTSLGHALSQVTDTKGNTWEIDEQSTNTTFVRAAMASTPQDVGTLTTSDTITATYAASGNVSCGVFEYSGLVGGTSGYTDGTGQNNSGTNATSGSATASTANASSIMVTCVATGNTQTSYTYPTGFAARTTGEETASSGGVAAADDTGTAGTYTANWSWTGISTAWAICMVGYLAAAAAPTPPPLQPWPQAMWRSAYR